MGGQVVCSFRFSSNCSYSLPAIDIPRIRVAQTVMLLLTFQSRYRKGQSWQNITILFSAYVLGLTNFASSMSQIVVVILK